MLPKKAESEKSSSFSLDFIYRTSCFLCGGHQTPSWGVRRPIPVLPQPDLASDPHSPTGSCQSAQCWADPWSHWPDSCICQCAEETKEFFFTCFLPYLRDQIQSYCTMYYYHGKIKKKSILVVQCTCTAILERIYLLFDIQQMCGHIWCNPEFLSELLHWQCSHIFWLKKTAFTLLSGIIKFLWTNLLDLSFLHYNHLIKYPLHSFILYKFNSLRYILNTTNN